MAFSLVFVQEGGRAVSQFLDLLPGWLPVGPFPMNSRQFFGPSIGLRWKGRFDIFLQVPPPGLPRLLGPSRGPLSAVGVSIASPSEIKRTTLICFSLGTPLPEIFLLDPSLLHHSADQFRASGIRGGIFPRQRALFLPVVSGKIRFFLPESCGGNGCPAVLFGQGEDLGVRRKTRGAGKAVLMTSPMGWR